LFVDIGLPPVKKNASHQQCLKVFGETLGTLYCVISEEEEEVEEAEEEEEA